MSDFNKIPFGLREKDQQFVDVYDVPNGKQCGCICPSCHTPLEARQGDINVWHFAHASKKVYKKTSNECEYSFYLSIRLMARQLLGNKIEIGLPAYKDSITYYSEVFGYSQYKEFLVTAEKVITVEDILVEQSFCGVAVDVIGKVGQFDFVIYFSHPGRNVPHELLHPDNDHCGVVEVKLGGLSEEFMFAKANNKTYDSILSNFLTKNKTSKRWIYHPRYAIKKEQAIKEIENSGQRDVRVNDSSNIVKSTLHNSYSKKLDTTDLPVLNTRMANYKCVLCNSEWQGYEAGGNICPKCNTHLYSRVISLI